MSITESPENEAFPTSQEGESSSAARGEAKDKVYPERSPRVNARLQVRFGPDADMLTGYAVNLSSGGLFLEIESPLPVDSPLALEFEIPGSERKIQCRGRVAWINPPENPLKNHFPPGMGIQFLDLTLADMEILRSFIKERLLQANW